MVGVVEPKVHFGRFHRPDGQGCVCVCVCGRERERERMEVCFGVSGRRTGRSASRKVPTLIRRPAAQCKQKQINKKLDLDDDGEISKKPLLKHFLLLSCLFSFLFVLSFFCFSLFDIMGLGRSRMIPTLPTPIIPVPGKNLFLMCMFGL